MDQKELEIILAKHRIWLLGEPGGERANLSGANLSGANLVGTNLKETNLAGANMAGADMEGTDMEGANLKETNLRRTNMVGAYLERANLEGADIDYSAWPLWCYSLDLHVDERQVAQLLYHVLSLVKYSKHISEETKQLLMTKNNLAVALRFHRADECRRLSMEDTENDKQK